MQSRVIPSRRGLLTGAAVTLAFAGAARAQTAADAPTYRNEVDGYGALTPDPYGVFDLPAGFSYKVISQVGETMSDGLLVPYKMDGMGAFAGPDGATVLVRNHELGLRDMNTGPAGFGHRLLDRLAADKAYDRWDTGRPLNGGTTTLVYDTRTQRLVSQHQSLIGTAVNCAGGVTPWGSWLTCEETLIKPGSDPVGKAHGWVFEVPSAARGLVEPVPLKAMGRFKHEAACVDPRTGVVYLTEDQNESLFYRFLPAVPGELAHGGRLQALGFRDASAGADARNWEAAAWAVGEWKDAVWIDLDNVESPDDNLRLRGHASGAAIFARGEGIHWGDGELYFTATSGGPAKRGQILRYVPSPREGQADEAAEPGRLQLFLQTADESVFNMGDNLTVAPWGHLIVCEDNYSPTLRNHLKGVTPDGRVYTIGRNVYRDNAELAGVCFSPDGGTLFVNVYYPGMTLAITGPWGSLKAS
ncbi:MAG TPA: alkaline phosphatase PhoX [Caulobacteraceae bacterium]